MQENPFCFGKIEKKNALEILKKKKKVKLIC